VIEMTTADKATALSASSLQPSDHPSADQIRAAIRVSLLRNGGTLGCAAVRAAEYGDHPESAAARMRWARQTVDGYASRVAA
jgi:hypothetical protein